MPDKAKAENILKPPVLQLDDDLQLRQFTVADRFDIFDLFQSDPARLERYSPGITKRFKSPDDVAEWLQSAQDAKYRVLNTGLWKNQDLLGEFDLTLTGRPDTASIAFCLAPQYEGQGLATLASRALVDFAFSLPDIEFVRALTLETNLRSQKVMERLGMVSLNELNYEGITYKSFMISKTDWQRPPAAEA